MANPNDYTVGWICALKTELSAAKALLDELHEDCPPVAQHDNNSYALGRISGHNVVIVVMPSGEHGTTSAAAVARDMVHSFPNVRIGLLVGIGGGAPSPKHDVRLGDVVVSSRDGGKGGVFQYDFGKDIQGQDISFQHTDFLNQPPTVLRTAVSALESRYEMEGHRLNAVVNGAFEQWPRLRKRYSRPPPNSDKLYHSDFIHPNPSDVCSSVCGDDPAHLVRRVPRDELDNDPAIHYGLIASANRVMKNATLRDQLAMEKDVLCFEMEAAGLMNHFPCLVVRGICDYSDSHKNDEWQGFAAMMAAAYAKDLLRQIPPSKVEAESRIGDALDIDRVHQDVNVMKDDVEATRQDKYLKKLYLWLSTPDPSTNAALARTRKHPGTGDWFLNSATFREWKTDERQHLWLYGQAGCGKTVLSTTILDHLEETSPDLTLKFFFDFNNTGNQTLESLLRSLAFQLYRAGGEAARRLDELFKSNSNGQIQPGMSALSACVESMLKVNPRVHIVLDALDECTTRTQLLTWIRCFASESGICNTKLIVTGRPEDEFKRDITRLFKENNCMLLDKKAVNEDIHSYVTNELHWRPDFVEKKMPPDILEQILTRVGDGADGMFGWATCQLDTLAKCLHLQAIQEALKSLPSDLNETYKRMIQNIPTELKSDAIRLLQFLVHAEQPLVLSAAMDIIATQIDGEQKGFSKSRRLLDADYILRYCPSLVVITDVPRRRDDDDEEDLLVYDDDWSMKEIHLAHFSVKEYRARDEQFQLATAGAAIAKTCLTYLTDIKVVSPRTIESDFPLARYAAKVWMHYVRLAEHSDDVFQQSLLFFQDEAAFQQWVCVCSHFETPPWSSTRTDPPSSPKLHYACHGGLSRVARSLLEKGADANERGDRYANALQAALSNGHQEVVQILLDNGADIN
ncbi:purine and uridine phosphorylase, partial [Colletotrichum zoysiae]